MKYSSSFLQKIFDKFRPLQIFDDGESDQDLRMLLAKAMKSIDPAFDWICEVYSETGSLIYSTYVIMGGSYQGVMKYFRRTFSLSADGKSVEINDDAVEVRPKQVWETVEDPEEELSSEPTVTAAKSCSCDKENESNSSSSENGKVVENIENNTDNGDDNIKEVQMGNQQEKPAESTVAAVTSEPAVASQSSQSSMTPPTTLTEDEALALCPSLRSKFDKFRAQEENKKSLLVSQLSEAQSVISKEALQTRTLEQLEEYAALMGVGEGEGNNSNVIDYSFRGAQEVQSGTKVERRKLPDVWNLNKNKETAK